MQWSFSSWILAFLRLQYADIWLRGTWLIGSYESVFGSYRYLWIKYLCPINRRFGPSTTVWMTNLGHFNSLALSKAWKYSTMLSSVTDSSKLGDVLHVPLSLSVEPWKTKVGGWQRAGKCKSREWLGKARGGSKIGRVRGLVVSALLLQKHFTTEFFGALYFDGVRIYGP